MKISIIGASAGIGFATLKRALDLNCEITTLSRKKPNLKKCENLNPIIGSALNEADLKLAIKNAEAIIVTLGTGMNISRTTLYSDFAKNLLKIHTESPITVPVIIVTGFGTSESFSYLPFFIKPIFKLILGNVYKDKSLMENMISKSNLLWEFVRPALLTNKTFTGKYLVLDKLQNSMKVKIISRSDVANFLIKEAITPKYIHKSPALTNAYWF